VDDQLQKATDYVVGCQRFRNYWQQVRTNTIARSRSQPVVSTPGQRWSLKIDRRRRCDQGSNGAYQFCVRDSAAVPVSLQRRIAEQRTRNEERRTEPEN
jgi:hypothetical protein